MEKRERQALGGTHRAEHRFIKQALSEDEYRALWNRVL